MAENTWLNVSFPTAPHMSLPVLLVQGTYLSILKQKEPNHCSDEARPLVLFGLFFFVTAWRGMASVFDLPF